VPYNYTKKNKEKIRLNIGTDQEGDFYFDDIYLGLSSQQESYIPREYKEKIQYLEPAFIRMSWLNIGGKNKVANSWVQSQGVEEGLRLLEGFAPDAIPWIPIDSHASDAQIRNLLEYLAGPISSEFGFYRYSNGSSVSWTNRFEKIIIEFTDKDHIFERDAQKADYVNDSILNIETSAYYKELKNKLIFVDSMVYKDGIMLSRADYYGLDYSSQIQDPSLLKIKDELGAMSSFIPRNPDKLSDISFTFLKIKDASGWSQGAKTSELVTYFMDTVGDQTLGILPDLDFSRRETTSAALERALKITFNSIGDTRQKLVNIFQSSDDLEISSYAFRKDANLTVVVASLDNSPVMIKLNINLSKGENTYIRYDQVGRIVEKGWLKKEGQKLKLMPGDVLVAQYLPGKPEE